MNTLHLFVGLALVGSVVFLFVKGLTTLFDWLYKFEGERAANKIVIGSLWRSKKRDPWSEPYYCTVVDKEGEWLRYQYQDSDYLWSARAIWWKDSWELVESSNDDE